MFDPNKLNLDPNSKKPEEENKNIIEQESSEEKEVNSYLEEKNNKNDEIKNKSNNEQEQKVEKQEIEEEAKKIIFDININSLQDILNILIEKQYDFVIFEPNEESVKISFFKDKVIKQEKNIKYPIYSKIIIKAKTITKLDIEETEKEQQGKIELNLKNNSYELVSKTTGS
jgi:type II secretory ATPase GspE/PulE/Tfp pilus assembly ATPase PilB-like protein